MPIFQRLWNAVGSSAAAAMRAPSPPPARNSNSSKKSKQDSSNNSTNETKSSEGSDDGMELIDVGTELKQYRKRLGWMMGHVTEVRPDNTATVEYENGEQENLNRKQLRRAVAMAEIQVGSRIAVYWKVHKRYYEASVIKERKHKECFFIRYDFGEREWIDLNQHKFHILPEIKSEPEPEPEPVTDDKEQTKSPSPPPPPPKEEEKLPPAAEETETKSPPNDSTRVVTEETDGDDGGGGGGEEEEEPSAATEKINEAKSNGELVSKTVASEKPEEAPADEENASTGEKMEEAQRDDDETESEASNAKMQVDNDEEEPLAATTDVVDSVKAGSRISLWWEEDNEYYEATVVRIRRGRKEFFLEFGDGEREWFNLKDLKFNVITEENDEKEEKGGGGDESHAEKSGEVQDEITDEKPEANEKIDEMNVTEEKDEKEEEGGGDESHAKKSGQGKDEIADKKPEANEEIDEMNVTEENDEKKEEGGGDESHAKKSGQAKDENADEKSKENEEIDEMDEDADGDESEVSNYSENEAEDDDSNDDDDTNEDDKKPATNAEVSKFSVGERVAVWFPRDRKYYNAEILRMRRRTGNRMFCFVKYDDGSQEWIDFDRHKRRLLRSKRLVADESSEHKGRHQKGSAAAAAAAKQNDNKSEELFVSEDESDDNDEDEFVESADPSKVTVGSRVAVWWPDDRKYYNAEVAKYKRHNRKLTHYLKYDDGDEEWIDFKDHNFHFLPSKPAGVHNRIKNGHKKPRDGLAAVSIVEVGTRVAVWWKDEEEYFLAMVTRTKEENGAKQCYIVYDDGDQEWIDLAKERFYIVDSEMEAQDAEDSELEDSDASDDEHASKAEKEEGSEEEHPFEDEADSEDEEEEKGKTSDIDKVGVGTRVSIWWGGEKQFFDGTVTKTRQKEKGFFVKYDDGDKEWLDLESEKWMILEENDAGSETESEEEPPRKKIKSSAARRKRPSKKDATRKNAAKRRRT